MCPSRLELGPTALTRGVGVACGPGDMRDGSASQQTSVRPSSSQGSLGPGEGLGAAGTCVGLACGLGSDPAKLSDETPHATRVSPWPG